MTELIVVFLSFGNIVRQVWDSAIWSVEWIDACLMRSHADKDVFLWLLCFSIGIEEGIEDSFKGLNLVNWSLLLRLVCILHMSHVRITREAEHCNGQTGWLSATRFFRIVGHYRRITTLHISSSGFKWASVSLSTLTSLSLQLIEVLLTIVEEILGVLDLVSEVLDWFGDSDLQSWLEEEEEGDEDEDIEEKQDDLEPQ